MHSPLGRGGLCAADGVPPNMALQRTRPPSLRSGRSLRSLGSPLNAYPFGASLKLVLIAFSALSYSSFVSAAPAVRLVVFAPCVGPQPQPCHFTTANPGVPFPIGVYAIDAMGAADRSYSGTINFSSTDPLALLPSSYTFLPTDNGVHVFLDALTLRTLGEQTIVATDVSGQIAAGSLALNVVPIVPFEPIPSLTVAGAVAFGVSLAVFGSLLARLAR
jgi:hypothetical protein